ncbi:hypothetical protein ABH37_18690 [Mycobacterium haemophilum]|uniref:Uncharacterized protein n=1 Tax=Mycobacterium haemophilum TaxID=29311 RepID=A0A0I9UN52_9MYCO|nr:hypothetical protein ABH39_19330 [Mycobacterium haemophilum]KLO34205.1 hypothetical protein ABH38_19600 [Mycobacterium haemophilum]KLO38311.1 hypothetical protein ABH37_18690 [Mycobacterium haemophilum]KLO43508.1 hypothetical protein ABH36_19825 [Mycobacterium haemophilum]
MTCAADRAGGAPPPASYLPAGDRSSDFTLMPSRRIAIAARDTGNDPLMSGLCGQHTDALTARRCVARSGHDVKDQRIPAVEKSVVLGVVVGLGPS